MKLTTVREIWKNREAFLDQEITIGGWVRSNRDSKAFGFLMISDGSFFEQLQVVYHDTMPNFAEICKVNVGAALIIRGKLVATPQAKQPFEIQAEEVTIEGASAPDYPLQKKRHSPEFLRTITHLRPRTNLFQATQPVPGDVPGALRSGLRDPPLLPGARFCVCPHSAHHLQRR